MSGDTFPVWVVDSVVITSAFSKRNRHDLLPRTLIATPETHTVLHIHTHTNTVHSMSLTKGKSARNVASNFHLLFRTGVTGAHNPLFCVPNDTFHHLPTPNLRTLLPALPVEPKRLLFWPLALNSQRTQSDTPPCSFWCDRLRWSSAD